MSNYIKRIAKKGKKRVSIEKGAMSNAQVINNAICNYIDYYINKGANEFKIDFVDNKFCFWANADLSKEELQSEEHKKALNVLYFALTGRTDCSLRSE